MAQIALVYVPEGKDPRLGEALWTTLQASFVNPVLVVSTGPLHAGVFAHYPGEPDIVATRHGPDFTLGFGAAPAYGGPGEAMPPWFRCDYEASTQAIHVRADRYGFALMAYRLIDGVCALATSLPALGRLDPSLPPDRSALAEMLAFDQLLAERTHLRGLSLVPPGHDVELSPRGPILQRRFALSDIRLEPKRSLESTAQTLAAKFTESIESLVAANRARKILVPLSGGLDSRLIAAAAREAGAPIETFTFAQVTAPGEAPPPDVALAERVARELGVAWRFVALEDDWICDRAERAIELTDGHADLLHSTGIAPLGKLEPGALLLDGLGGDVALRASFLSPRAFLCFGFEARARELWRQRARLDQVAWRELLHAEAYHELRKLAVSSLQSSLHQVVDELDSSDMRWSDFWILRHRTRRFTNNGAYLWRSWACPVFPFLAPHFLESLLAVDPKLRFGGRLQKSVLHRGWPRMAAIPWQKTGRPVPKPGFRGFLANRLAARSIPARRPFFDFNLAFLRSAREQSYFKQMLLDRGGVLDTFDCFERSSVERLIQTTLAGSAQGMSRMATLTTLLLTRRLYGSVPP